MAIDFDSLVLEPLAAIFGEDLTYTPAGGSAYTVTGVFFDGFESKVLLDDGAPGFATSGPSAGVRVAEFAALPQQNDQLTRPSTGLAYYINEVEADGVGNVVLRLSLVTGP